jgi:hypothetical protein
MIADLCAQIAYVWACDCLKCSVTWKDIWFKLHFVQINVWNVLKSAICLIVLVGMRQWCWRNPLKPLNCQVCWIYLKMTMKQSLVELSGCHGDAGWRAWGSGAGESRTSACMTQCDSCASHIGWCFCWSGLKSQGYLKHTMLVLIPGLQISPYP